MSLKIYLFSLFTIFLFYRTDAMQFTPSDEKLTSICDSYNLDFNEYRQHFNTNYFVKQNQYHDFILLTTPKTGTYLLDKLLILITGRTSIWADRTPIYLEKHQDEFVLDHGILFNTNFNFQNRKIITTYRDFRDQLISFIYYNHWGLTKNWTLSREAVQNNLIEILKDLKAGTLPKDPNANMETVKNTIIMANFWRQKFNEKQKNPNIHSNMFFVKFEDIIGEKGNGTYLNQFETIQKLTQYLNLSLSENQIDYLIKTLHGKSYSFREGKTGNWRDVFTEEHKKLFKELFNHFLVDFGYEKDEKW